MPSSRSSLMDDQDSWERLSNVSSTPSLLQMSYTCAASPATNGAANGDHSNDPNDSAATYNPSLLSIKNVVDHERKTSSSRPATDEILGVLLADNSVMASDLPQPASSSGSSGHSNGYRNNKQTISIGRTKFVTVDNWDFDCSNRTSSDEIVGCGNGADDTGSFCSGSGSGQADGVTLLAQIDMGPSGSGPLAPGAAQTPPASSSSSSSASASFWSQFHIVTLTNVLSFLIGCSIGILLNRNVSGGSAALAAAAAAATASTAAKGAGSAATGRFAGFFLRFPKFY